MFVIGRDMISKIDHFNPKGIQKFEKEILKREKMERKKQKSYISMEEENESNKESEQESQ